MPKSLIVLILAAAFLPGCQKSQTTTSTAAKSGDPVQQKLQELAGGGASDCGRPKSQTPDQIKPASDCAMKSAQDKRAFYVAYEMPGLTVGVAGNSEGKLFAVQSEQSQVSQAGAAAEVKSTPCPAPLRVAESGRVTCFAPSSFMGSSGTAPHGGMMAAPAGAENPHGEMTMPPSGTPNPHGGGMAAPAHTPNPHGASAPPKQQ